jgi:hypothetical protein
MVDIKEGISGNLDHDIPQYNTNCVLKNRDIISANSKEEYERWHDVCR